MPIESITFRPTSWLRGPHARPLLRQIAVPAWIIASRDGPFSTAKMLPEADELGPQVTLELADHGGHVGFVGPGGRPWIDGRVVDVVLRALTATQTVATRSAGVDAAPRPDKA